MNTPSINPTSLRQVIEYLEARYPNKLPRTPMGLDSLHIKIGEQHPIETLRELLEHLER